MECEFCGEEITEGALACPRCGSPVAKRPAPAPQQTAQGGAPAGPTQQQPPAPPVEPPLAKLEEDFIALAEESVPVKEGGVAPPPGAAPPPPLPDATADISALVDASVPPGARVAADTTVLDHSMTSGYKAEGSQASVAGAGEQTAEDPFGLNITEKEPPVIGPSPLEARRQKHRVLNLVIMFTALLFFIAVVVVGVYFLFIRKSKPAVTSPVVTVQDFFIYAAGQADTKFPTVAITSAPLIQQTRDVLFPYVKDGTLTLSGYDAIVNAEKGDKAEVQLKKLVVKVRRFTGGEVYEKDLLDPGTKPYPIPSVIELKKVDGKWYIDS